MIEEKEEEVRLNEVGREATYSPAEAESDSDDGSDHCDSYSNGDC